MDPSPPPLNTAPAKTANVTKSVSYNQAGVIDYYRRVGYEIVSLDESSSTSVRKVENNPLRDVVFASEMTGNL
jgi:hypothetical protein